MWRGSRKACYKNWLVRPLASSLRKIEKARATLLQKQPPPKSQLTLARRNLAALRVALALIERKMGDKAEIES